TREDPTLHERAELERAVAADGVQEATAVRSEGPVDDSREVAVVLAPNVLEHPDGHECIVGPEHVAIVVVDELDTIREALEARALAGPGELLAGHVEGADPDAVVACQMQRQGAPPAAGLDHALAGVQPELARDVLHLRDLRVLEGCGGSRKVG